jgi:hypothetical protein
MSPERQTPGSSGLLLYLVVFAAFVQRQVTPLGCKNALV